MIATGAIKDVEDQRTRRELEHEKSMRAEEAQLFQRDKERLEREAYEAREVTPENFTGGDNGKAL